MLIREVTVQKMNAQKWWLDAKDNSMLPFSLSRANVIKPKLECLALASFPP
jgi:hypothetical protein